MKKITLLFTILISVIAIQISFAAPSLTITKPPVTPMPSWTGPGAPLDMPPPGDPHAEQGQWFVDKATGTIFTNRTCEFYDNVDPYGGGYQSCTAIFGYVSFINWGGPGTPILAFDIVAIINNDIPAFTSWEAGDNSHSEQRAFSESQKFEGSLLDVKLTAEFSIDPAVPPPASWTGPYTDRQPYIEALNHDELAWYCWTSDEANAPHPPGNFHVPTWDFGNIPQGRAATNILQFQIQSPGLQPADPRYLAIESSFTDQSDILLNRTKSLKISDWIEDLALDTCVPYPDDPNRSSDVSVFHNIPEPGIIAGISIILLGLYRRIKQI